MAAKPKSRLHAPRSWMPGLRASAHAGIGERAAQRQLVATSSHQEHRRVLHRRHRAAASGGDVAADRRQHHRGARSAAGHQGRRGARRGRERGAARPGRRPRPSGVRRMDADPGHHRLDRQLPARRHHHLHLGLRAARARARLRESLARSRDLARGRHRRDHRPGALERRAGARRHRHSGARHDGGAFRPAGRSQVDPRQVHLLSARRPQGRGAAVHAVVPRPRHPHQGAHRRGVALGAQPDVRLRRAGVAQARRRRPCQRRADPDERRRSRPADRRHFVRAGNLLVGQRPARPIARSTGCATRASSGGSRSAPTRRAAPA